MTRLVLRLIGQFFGILAIGTLALWFGVTVDPWLAVLVGPLCIALFLAQCWRDE